MRRAENDLGSPPGNRIATIVPDWMREALAVLLNSLPDSELLAQASSVDELLALQLPQAPDVIVMDCPSDPRTAREQLVKIERAWPEAFCLVLARHERERAYLLAYGADRVLLKDVLPQRLASAIRDR